MADLKPSQLTRIMRPVPQELLDFMAWYFDGGIKLKPPQDGLLFQQRPGTTVSSVVLYRDGRFQVELIMFAPGSSIPEHRHDSIDSCEVLVSGEIDLFVDGRQVAYQGREPRPDGVARDALKWVPIPHDAYHGGRASSHGGCFLSVQMWRGMDPSHVGLEWQDRADRSFA